MKSKSKISGSYTELSKLALRNLSRHKLKTVITVFAVTVSVTLYIFMDGLLSGVNADSRRNIVNYETGAAKLQTKLYFEKKDELPSYESFSGWETYADILDKAGYYSAPRFVFSGTLYSKSGTAPVIFHGVEPESEAKVLRYTGYIEAGRYIQNGAVEIALGISAAEKLKVGIPMRPLIQDLDELIEEAAADREERDFISSLYEPLVFKGGFFSPDPSQYVAAIERMVLKKNISPEAMERYWNILERSGRNNVQIGTVIDIKAAPEKIRRDKWEGELMPALSAEDRLLMEEAYQYESMMDTFLINEEIEADSIKMARVLEAMIRSGFSGAIRHINQVFSAVVAGLINSPDPVTNSNVAYIPLDVLQDEGGMMLEGNVTEILIRSKDRKEADLPGKNESAAAITAALEHGFADRGQYRYGQDGLPQELAVFTWRDYVQGYLGLESVNNYGIRAIMGLLLLLSFFGISNTVLLAILERTREIGMMRAMGMTDGQMIKVYMIEAGFLGLFGSVFGIIAGCLINYPLVKYGIDLSAMSDSVGGDDSLGYRVASLLRSMWNIPVIAGTGAIATIIASIMAFFPARRAVKMPITDSLRFE